MFYLTIVNKILHHCHSWMARQYISIMKTFYAVLTKYEFYPAHKCNKNANYYCWHFNIYKHGKYNI